MIILFFISLLFFIFFLMAIKQKRILFAYLIGIYLLSFLSTFFLNHYEPQTNIYLGPTIYFIFVLCLWLFPFKGIRPDNLENIQYKKKKVQILIILIGLLSFFSLLFFLYYCYKLFTSFDLKIVRDMIHKESFLPAGLFTAFLVIVSSLYFINLFLFFFSLREKFNWLYPFIMFVSSLSFPIMVLCYFGRDGVLYWGLNFIVLFFLFKKSLPKKNMRKIKKVGFIFLVSFCVLFVVITISRFGKDYQKTYISLLSYSGQQMQNFSEAYKIKTSTYSLLPGCERLMVTFGIFKDVNRDEVTLIKKAFAGSEYNVFGFFVKDFIWAVGRLWTILLSLVIYIFINIIDKKYKKKRRIEDFMILFTIFQIPMNGVFYYRQSVSYMDIGILLCFFIYFIFKICIISKKNIV